jgi:hypothetical protein
MKSYANFKFIILTVLIGIGGLVLRLAFLKYSWDVAYLGFLAGVFSMLFIFYLSVSISVKQHNWRNGLSLVCGALIVYSIIHYEDYDKNFYTEVGGMIFSLALISLTLNVKARKWFLSSKSLASDKKESVS